MKKIKFGLVVSTLCLLMGCATRTPQPNDFATFKNPDNSEKRVSINYDDMPYEAILNNTFGTFGISTIYQDRIPMTTTYKLTAINKPIRKILQTTLNAQCLAYQKLSNKQVSISKNRGNTRCKPLPAGSQIRVN